MISRWCAAAEPEVWTALGQDGEPDVAFAVDQHRRCVFERRKGHDDECHRVCCWSAEETESRDCTCPCHPDAASHEVLPVIQDVPQESPAGGNTNIQIGQ